MSSKRCACSVCDCKYNTAAGYGDVCKYCEGGDHRESGEEG